MPKDFTVDITLEEVHAKLQVPADESGRGMGGSWTFDFTFPKLSPLNQSPPLVEAKLPKNGKKKVGKILVKDEAMSGEEGELVILTFTLKATEKDAKYPDSAQFLDLLIFPLKAGESQSLSVQGDVLAWGGDEPAKTRLTFTLKVEVKEQKKIPEEGPEVGPEEETDETPPIDPKGIVMPILRTPEEMPSEETSERNKKKIRILYHKPGHPKMKFGMIDPNHLRRVAQLINSINASFRTLQELFTKKQGYKGKVIKLKPPAYLNNSLEPLLDKQGREILVSDEGPEFTDLLPIKEVRKKLDEIYNPISNFFMNPDERFFYYNLSAELIQLQRLLEQLNQVAQVRPKIIEGKGPAMNVWRDFAVVVFNADKKDFGLPVTVKVTEHTITSAINYHKSIPGPTPEDDQNVGKVYINGTLINDNEKRLGEEEFLLPSTGFVQGKYHIPGNYGTFKVEASFTDAEGNTYTTEEFPMVVEFKGPNEETLRDMAEDIYNSYESAFDFLEDTIFDLVIDGILQLMNAALDEAKDGGSLFLPIPYLGNLIYHLVKFIGETSENTLQAYGAIGKGIGYVVLLGLRIANAWNLEGNFRYAEQFPEMYPKAGTEEMIHRITGKLGDYPDKYLKLLPQGYYLPNNPTIKNPSSFIPSFNNPNPPNKKP